jgi:hypothetical protein
LVVVVMMVRVVVACGGGGGGAVVRSCTRVRSGSVAVEQLKAVLLFYRDATIIQCYTCSSRRDYNAAAAAAADVAAAMIVPSSVDWCLAFGVVRKRVDDGLCKAERSGGLEGEGTLSWVVGFSFLSSFFWVFLVGSRREANEREIAQSERALFLTHIWRYG